MNLHKPAIGSIDAFFNSMTAQLRNFTTFAVQSWWIAHPVADQPITGSPIVFSVICKLLLIYATVTCNFIGLNGIALEDFPPPDRPRTLWIRLAVTHLTIVFALGLYASILEAVQLWRAGYFNIVLYGICLTAAEFVLKQEEAR